MLVLSRKQNQKIHVGDDITITILKIRGNSVRIGIEAPKSVHVMRGELERQEDDMALDATCTVEFRSNGVDTDPGRPELRLIDDAEAVNVATPPAPNGGRLSEIVALASEQRRSH
ncbi:MAG: carbon storage regulator [Pirellulaceae bacterium]